MPSPVADCEWTIDAVPGGRVVVSILRLSLPISEFCIDSFVEFRESNASGTLIGRYCGIAPRSVESEGPMWIRLRHRAEEGEGEDAQGGGGEGGATEAESIGGGELQNPQKTPPTIVLHYSKGKTKSDKMIHS